MKAYLKSQSMGETMILRLITIGALLAIAGCTTTSPSNQNICTSSDRGRLAGLKSVAALFAPDPTSERGRAAIKETAELEAKCAK